MFKKIITVTAVNFILLFLLLEVSLRIFFPQQTGPVQYIYHDQLGAIPIPNLKGKWVYPPHYTYSASHDINGNRIQNGTNSDKIAFIGDSFTYGVGVNDEQTFSWLTQQSDRIKSNVSILNAGNPGTGTDYALRYIETNAKNKTIKHFVIFFYPNDFNDNGCDRYYSETDTGLVDVPTEVGFNFFKQKQSLAHSKFYNFFSNNVHTWSLLKRYISNIKLKAGGIRDLKQFLTNSANVLAMKNGFGSTPNLRVTRKILSRLFQFSESNHIKISFVYIPTLFEVDEFRKTNVPSNDELEFSKLIKSTKNSSLVFYGSLTSSLASSNFPIDKLYYPEGHWTANAHAIASENLIKMLEKNRLLSKLP